MTGVESARVGVLQPPHALNEVGSGGLNEKVVVVPHQHPRPNPYPGALTAFPQGLEEEFLIVSIERSKDSVPSIATRHNVVESSFVFDSHLTRHFRCFYTSPH
jgi:hypothetical protein